MKNLYATVTIVIVLLLTACFVPTQQPITSNEVALPSVELLTTPTPVSFAALLEDALAHYEAGDYEEAILYYEMAVEIESRSFDAQFGLGKSYRAAKLTEKAVASLEAAAELSLSNRDVLLELGYAYLDIGSYERAEELAKTLLENDSPDMEVGVVLMISLAAQERIEDMQMLMENEGFFAYINTLANEGNAYVGQYNEDGKRHGKGIGLYRNLIYVGDYENGLRSGQGIWQGVRTGAGSWVFIGVNGNIKLYKKGE